MFNGCVSSLNRGSDPKGLTLIWVKHFTYGMRRLCISHCGMCKLSKAPHTYTVIHTVVSTCAMGYSKSILIRGPLRSNLPPATLREGRRSCEFPLYSIKKFTVITVRRVYLHFKRRIFGHIHSFTGIVDVYSCLIYNSTQCDSNLCLCIITTHDVCGIGLRLRFAT